MCLFCCDMLCWFSFITCCGCRDMVTRRLVFFPPDPYYDHIEPNEQFNDFYHRLSSKPELSNDSDDSKQDNNNDDLILKVNTNPKPSTKKHNKKQKHTKFEHHTIKNSQDQNEMEALNSSDDTCTISDDHIQIKTKNTHIPMNKNIFGTFRIKNDETNLAKFYWNNYNIKMNHFESQYLLTKRGTTIPSYYIKHPQSKYCILFSHGNAADIGLMRNHLCRMYEKCKVSIFAYEYSGYGKSSGRASEKNTYSDIETAYKYCLDILHIPACHIILYGQSLGTCVSVYLASIYPVGGVILHSPLMSGLRVMQSFDKTYWFDIYPVVDQIQHVFAPIWIIHGQKDKEIDVIHGKILSRIAPNAYQPWFVPYAGHNDIEVLFPDVLFKKIGKFIRYLNNLEKTYRNEMGVQVDGDDDDEDDTVRMSMNVGNVKSVTQKIADESISPPPPQSILTKSQDRMRQIALPSRKFSHTGNSLIDDEESVETPSLSIKDSNFISISMKGEEKSTNKGYDAVLTPTMRTIMSKEQSTSEMLALPHTIDGNDDVSNTNTTMSTFHFSTMNKQYRDKNIKSRMIKNVRSSHPDIDEEEKGEHGDIDGILTDIELIKKRKKRKKNNPQRLNLPQFENMIENIKICHERRDKLLIEDVNNESEESSCSDEEVNVNVDENENVNVNVDDGDSQSLSSDDIPLEQNVNTSNKKNIKKNINK